MADVLFSVGGPFIRGMTHDDDFEFVVTESPSNPSSATVTQVDMPDAVGETIQATGSTNTFILGTAPVSLGGPPVTLESLTPYTCTIDAAGRVSKPAGNQGGGTCTISARSAYGQRTFTREIVVSGSSQTSRLVNYKAGTLAAHINDVVRGVYAGQPDPSLASLHIHEWDRRHWRANRIAPNIDMSWQSVDANDGSAFPCSLISPRHALCAAHAGFGVGRQYVFMTPGGSLIYPTVVRKWQQWGSDLGMLYFDIPVTGCTLAKLAPDIRQKTSLDRIVGGVGSTLVGYKIPALITLFKDYFIPQEIYGGRKLMAVCMDSTLSWAKPDDALLYRFTPGVRDGQTTNLDKAGIREGDSGSAVFFPVIEPGKTTPSIVLMSACHGRYSGPNYSASVTEINAAMNSIKDAGDTTVYSVQQADLSAFTSF